MIKKIVKKTFTFLLTTALAAMIGGEQLFAKAKTELVKEEDGFYYGYGKASTAEEAEFIGKKDLIETALTTVLRLTDPAADEVTVSDEAVSARLTKIKPFQANKTGDNVTYRIKIADWEKDEKTFSEKLRSSLKDRYDSLSSNAEISKKIENAISILDELSANGERDLLTLQAGGSELFSKKVEALCSSIVSDLEITLSQPDGFVTSETKYSVSVKDSSGKPLSNINLKAVWELAELSITNPDVVIVSEEDAENPSVVSFIKTDSNGNAEIDFPLSDSFKNKCISLTVSTSFSNSPYAYSATRKLDAESSADACYVHFNDIALSHPVAEIQGGTYMAGAIEGDAKAGQREESHEVELKTFQISLYPVTNEEFASYLFATRGYEEPEYFENPTYNQAKQPVVGISWEEAEGYASWLSEQTGENWRLPTEEEWEIAARAGGNTIFPWGDEAPNKGKKANYKGNGKFKAPSPVGAFPECVNALGIADMSGNVWEMTSSAHLTEEGSSEKTVKGGSWMDGPNELRISNYKNVDPENRYPDVGFRLVKSAEEDINNEEE